MSKFDVSVEERIDWYAIVEAETATEAEEIVERALEANGTDSLKEGYEIRTKIVDVSLDTGKEEAWLDSSTHPEA